MNTCKNVLVKLRSYLKLYVTFYNTVKYYFYGNLG